jgi:alanyl-tRNA synthetase
MPDDIPPPSGTTPQSGTDDQQRHAQLDNADELGAAGKRALDEERNSRKAAERRAKQLEAELEQLRQASMSEQEKAIAAAKDEARREALAAANERILRSEIKAAAAGKLADPADAVAYLRDDMASFIDDSGDVDAKTLAKAIDDLVRAKPYLAATVNNPGSADGGPRQPAQAGDMNATIRRLAGRG